MLIAEYIWLDINGECRGKTRVLPKLTLIDDNPSKLVGKLPDWNYDGSSTGQAEGRDSEVVIKPVKVVNDPFHITESTENIKHVLVLCDTWLSNGDPHPSNTRHDCYFKTEQAKAEALFGFEQEFFIVRDGNPISSLEKPGNFPKPQGRYYCGIGGSNSFGRKVVEEAFYNCLSAGLDITGMNAEVAPAQWEIQVCGQDTDAGDQLHLLRYILAKTAEKYGHDIDLHPKPFMGDWNGSGCHTNYSTRLMRTDGGYHVILDAIRKLEKRHQDHIEVYGDDNHLRMTGQHETADIGTFSYGVANRGASIRIPRETFRLGHGYLEDRRPSSNMDPYLVISKIIKTTVLDV